MQALLVPETVRRMLALDKSGLFLGACRLYSRFSRTSVRTLVQQVLRPAEHLEGIRSFDRPRDRQAEPGLDVGIEN